MYYIFIDNLERIIKMDNLNKNHMLLKNNIALARCIVIIVVLSLFTCFLLLLLATAMNIVWLSIATLLVMIIAVIALPTYYLVKHYSGVNRVSRDNNARHMMGTVYECIAHKQKLNKHNNPVVTVYKVTIITAYSQTKTYSNNYYHKGAEVAVLHNPKKPNYCLIL